MKELNGFQRDVLYVIAGLGESNGVEVKEAIERYYGEKVYPGRLYPAMTELSKLGFIDKEKGTSNTYQITTEGEELLDDRAKWQRRQYTPYILAPLPGDDHNVI